MVEQSKIARLTQRIEQVAEALGRRPRAFVWVESHETVEQAKARYLAERPDHASHDFMFFRWRPPGSSERPQP